MGFLQGLHGTIAAVAICSLLFVDETGIPIPLAPNEVLLLIGGLLIADGSLPPWVFLPAATITMIAGMIAGYMWARAVGENTLRTLAAKIGAERHYDRTLRRLHTAGTSGIFVARLIPGVRPYATLISGAAGINLRKFLIGAVPALLVWELVWTILGMVVGLPVEHYLGRFERLALRGILLLGIGALAFLGLRRMSRELGVPGRWCPVRCNGLYTGVVDAAIVACATAGSLAVARIFMHTHSNAWIDLGAVVLAVGCYLIYFTRKHRVAGWTPLAR